MFPSELKCADVYALHKKAIATKKDNYRPSSILPTISKVLCRVHTTQTNLGSPQVSLI